LEINENTIQEMTTTLRKGIVAQEPTIELEGTVECDEVYVVGRSVKDSKTCAKRLLSR
jgi:hypothetical protein